MATPYASLPDLSAAMAGMRVDLSPLQQFAQQQIAQEQERYRRDMAERQFALQKAAADRQAAEADRVAQQRGDLKNWAEGQRSQPGVPTQLYDITGITGDAGPIKDWLVADAKRKAAHDGPEAYGKAGAVFQNPDGTFSAIQFGERGNLKTHTMGTGVAPAKGVTPVGDELVANATGQTVRNVAGPIANKEAAEKIGQARGTAIADLPRKQAAAEETLKVVDKLLAFGGQSGKAHPGIKGNFGVQGVFPNLPGGEAANASSIIEQVKSRAFLEAFNQIRGGGAITEAEGQKATMALIRAQNSQSVESFMEALADFRYNVQTGMELARRQAGIGGPNGNMAVDGSGRSFQMPAGWDGWSMQKVQPEKVKQ